MKARVCLMLAGVLVAGACGGSDPQSVDGSDSPSSTEAEAPTTNANDPTTAVPTTAVPTTAVPTTTGDTSTTVDDADPAEAWGSAEVTTDARACSTTEGGADLERAPTLMVVDRTTGELVWQMCQDGFAIGHSAVESDGVVVYQGSVAREGDTTELLQGLLGVDATTGDVLWSREAGGVALVGAGESVVFARASSADGQSPSPGKVLDPVIGIDARTGAELWRVDELSLALFPDAYSDTFVVAQGADDLGLRALEATTGDDRWRATTSGPFAVRDRGVIVLRNESSDAVSTVVLDPASGEDLWSAPGRPVWASDDVVYLAPDATLFDATSQVVEARSLTDGSVLSSFEMPGQPDPSVGAISVQGTPGDVLFVFGASGLAAVDGGDGSTLWTPQFLSVAGLDGETVVDTTSAAGVVRIVDARTGDVTGEVAIPCLAAGGACDVGYVQAVALSNDHLILSISNTSGG